MPIRIELGLRDGKVVNAAVAALPGVMAATRASIEVHAPENTTDAS